MNEEEGKGVISYSQLRGKVKGIFQKMQIWAVLCNKLNQGGL